MANGHILGGKPKMINTPEVRAIMREGDELSQRIGVMIEVTQNDLFKEVAPLDRHHFTLQIESMQHTLHILQIRLARANDAAAGRLPDTASALHDRKTIIKPN